MVGVDREIHPGRYLTPLTTPIPTFKRTLIPTFGLTIRPRIKLTILPTTSPTIRPTLSPSLIPAEHFTQMPLIQLTADDVRNGKSLIEVGRCLKIGPLLELLITTHAREEPICIEDIVGPKKIIQNFRQVMVVMVIGLVKVRQFVEKPWLSEKHGITMSIILMKGQCMRLRCVLEEHGSSTQKLTAIDG